MVHVKKEPIRGRLNLADEMRFMYSYESKKLYKLSYIYDKINYFKEDKLINIWLVHNSVALSWSSITSRSLVGHFSWIASKTSQLLAINGSIDGYTSGKQFILKQILTVPLDA